ncbi:MULTISPECIES: potassium-transporting ATPase subunit C [unclassified Streptomyces]|uniref:potassium-transporting ATPase subunit C n=1 Tax=unclassified Streptomyces TaxID=2593676 RepID=UPI002DD928A9|nr:MULTISPECIES: potassium-transporting ATPase subunit C [unclassified Streptomyces]WSB76293.1 potassium-transporting ATPase subunit C [Streptomyces sp. NBC_01775]WSS15432.1 potassium-transporting ATPase subunit C [Streptomyces sp. NBC_01186]WSS44275.1 potassium-transporting ATPase subunit C [Streptomyces sp. NBC_01187]
MPRSSGGRPPYPRNTSVRNGGRLVWAALRALLVLTVVCGVIYPLAVTGVAQAAFHDKADGSPVRADGKEVGSSLIGQSWNRPGSDKPDPRYFQGRPSHSGYDPRATGSSQLGADDPRLVKAVREARHEVARFNGVPESEVPKDAVTGSSSAIDPHVSADYARLQAARVARENGLSRGAVRGLVDAHTDGRTAGFLGAPHVNVLELNVAVRRAASR